MWFFDQSKPKVPSESNSMIFLKIVMIESKIDLILNKLNLLSEKTDTPIQVCVMPEPIKPVSAPDFLDELTLRVQKRKEALGDSQLW